MINEITKTFQDSVKERVSSPVLGSFILFLLAFNYETIIVFFSSGDPKQKIEFLPPFIWTGCLNIVYATALTIIFVYFYPIVSNKVYEYWDSKRAERRTRQRKHLNSEIEAMKPEEIAHLKRQLLEDEYHFNEILSGKNNLIDSQLEEIEELKNKIKELEKIAGDIYPGFMYDNSSGLPYKGTDRGNKKHFCPSCLAAKKAIPLINNLSFQLHCCVCDKSYKG